jgi:hypothetical protein
LESKQGGTLSDLRLFLLDAKYRKQFLLTVTDPEIVFYWQNVFPQLTGGKSIGPVLTRLQDFFTRKPLRNMVGQQVNRLDFEDIMDSGKIFLARLPEGCGEENSYLLGTLLVSKFQQLAMARQSQQASARRDFWLYIDEFDHFITPSMAKILSGVRKYRLGFTLAHQSLHQLHSDPKVESAVMTQPCTRIVFKVGDDDAKKLGEGFESFNDRSLKNLANFHAIARVERNDCDFNLALRKPELPDEEASQNRRKEIIASSRKNYASSRAKVEADLLARIWGQQPQMPATDESGDPPAPKTSPPKPPTPVVVPPPRDISPPAVLETPPPAIAEIKPVTDSEKESKPAIIPVVATVQPEESPAEAKSVVAEAKVPPKPGRGFDWHKTAQKRIKTEGEKLGFSAELEKQLAKGSMQAADVVLRRGHVHIAVEIASTSSNINHEFENLHKCLKAGFSHVVAIASEIKFLQGLEAAVQGALAPELAAKVSYHTTVQFIEELRRLAAASELPPPAQPLAAKEVRGDFEIERTFSPANAETQQVIHDIVTKAITTPDNS